MGAGCYHDHCTGPNTTAPKPQDSFTFLEDIPEGADDYEVERTESDEDEGCEGGGCKI